MVRKRRGVPPVPAGGFGPTGMRRARPPGATPPFDYKGANVKDWPATPETIRRLEDLLRKLEVGGAGDDVTGAVTDMLRRMGGGGSRPEVTTPPNRLRTRAELMSGSPSPNNIARSVMAGRGEPGSLVAQEKVEASERMKAAWKKLLTPGEHLEVQSGVERHLRSIKPQQLQMLHPAGNLPETLPQGVFGPARPGTGLIGTTPGDWLAAEMGTGNPAGTAPSWRRGLSGGTPADTWNYKLQEAKRPAGQGHGSGLWESIKAEGVRPTRMQGGQYVGSPVELAHQAGGLPPRIMEGHHRVAAAADINPAMEVPISNRPYSIYGGEVVMPDKRIRQIVPNEDIVKQLTKFGRKWGKNALRMMMKIPK